MMLNISAEQLCEPKIEVIDGRRYCINPFLTSDQSISANNDNFQIGMSSWEEEPEACSRVEAMMDSLTCVDTSDVALTKEGYRLDVFVPHRYYGFIIGKNRESLKRLEHETHTRITVPRGNSSTSNITIVGKDAQGPVSAKTRIELLVLKAKEREPFTHFLSIPFNSEEICSRLHEFKTTVLDTCGDARGLEENLFQRPRKLHCTLGTMVLASPEEERRAKEVLDSCYAQVIKPVLGDEPLVAKVEGIEYMNDDPGEVDVLYAKVEPLDGSDKLQRIADNMVTQFVNAGLMQRQYSNVKVHLTVINSKFGQDAPPKRGKDERREAGGITDSKQLRRHKSSLRESFDARDIIKVFGDYDFGEQKISTIHISHRFSAGHDGYYSALCKLKLP